MSRSGRGNNINVLSGPGAGSRPPRLQLPQPNLAPSSTGSSLVGTTPSAFSYSPLLHPLSLRLPHAMMACV